MAIQIERPTHLPDFARKQMKARWPEAGFLKRSLTSGSQQVSQFASRSFHTHMRKLAHMWKRLIVSLAWFSSRHLWKPPAPRTHLERIA